MTAVACGLVVVLVAASVFSIGSRSRKVVGHAADLHALNESLRSVTVVRSQVGFSAFLASVDAAYGTDSRRVIRASIVDARRGLGDTRSTVDAASKGSPLADPGLNAEIQVFEAQADRVISLVQSGRAAEARRATGDLDAGFERVRAELVKRRDTTLEQLVADDDRLWRLGALASFVVAFVVPACIVFVYMSLTRRPREEVQQQVERALDGRAQTRRRRLVDDAIATLRVTLAGGPRPGGAPAPELLDDLAVLLHLLDGGGTQRFGTVPVAALLAAVGAATTAPEAPVTTRSGPEQAWTDADAVRHLLTNLVRETRALGARRIELVSVDRSDHVQIAVVHDGAPLPPHLVRVLEGDPAADPGDAGTRILAAVAVAEGIGARLGALTEPRPALMVRIPAAASVAAGDGRPVPR